MVVNGTFIEMKHERRTQLDGTIAFFLVVSSLAVSQRRLLVQDWLCLWSCLETVPLVVSI